MRRPLRLIAVTALSLTASTAFAQRSAYDEGGPLLVPPAPGESQRDRERTRPDSSWSRGYSPGTSVGVQRRYETGPVFGGSDSAVQYRDSRMAQIANWYRDYLGRDMSRSEARNWEIYLQQKVGDLIDVQALLLGSPEFYDRAGGNFADWIDAVARATGRRLGDAEMMQWRDVYRNERNRVAFTKRFLNAQQSFVARPGRSIEYGTRRPDDRYSGYSHYDGHRHDGRRYEDPAPSPVWPGYGAIGSTPGSAPGFGSPFSGFGPDLGSPFSPMTPRGGWEEHARGHDHDFGHGREHTTLRPVAPLSEPEIIAEWYRSHFGREAGPHEVQKWLSDRQKGMPLSEVYASIIAAPEWYARHGSSPSNWIAATLDVLGQHPDSDAVGYWLDRYRRHGGDRFKTTMEMVGQYGMPGGLGSIDRRQGGRRDRFDDD